MPRYQSDREFQLGDFWLSKQSRSDAWCRTWFDAQARQTRRISLRTTDFEEAKQKLTDWFVAQHTPQQEPTHEITLAEVFGRYFELYGSRLRTADSTRRALNDWLTFHGEATIADACALPRQHAFQAYLRDERNMAANTSRRTLMIGKSALNWAYKRGEIQSFPYIELTKRPTNPPPKGRPLEVHELADLLYNADYHIQTFIIMMLATAGRTTATLELSRDRIDFSNELIMLNEQGREQTNKYRPTVKLPPSLKPWLLTHCGHSPVPQLIHFRGAGVKHIRTAWRTLRADLEFDDQVQPYSLRHTMARWLRKSSVPAWEVAAQLGHKMPDVSTTEIYAPFDPSYLFKATAAIDYLFEQLACELRVKDFSAWMLENLETERKQHSEWWLERDLNSRPQDYESCALTS